MLEKLLQHTLVRFISIGAAVEVIYLGLYSALLIAGLGVSYSILLAGLACISLNGYLQVRWSFRMKFSTKLLLKFYIVQSICLIVNICLGWSLAKISINDTVIGLTTVVTWGSLSFLLSKAIYKKI